MLIYGYVFMMAITTGIAEALTGAKDWSDWLGCVFVGFLWPISLPLQLGKSFGLKVLK